MSFDRMIKAMGGAIAFVELNNDSVWQVGIIPNKNPEELAIPECLYTYCMYICPMGPYYGKIGFIEECEPRSTRDAIVESTHDRYYGLIVSEELLPLGKIVVLCYKKVGIEEFPSENKEDEKCHI